MGEFYDLFIRLIKKFNSPWEFDVFFEEIFITEIFEELWRTQWKSFDEPNKNHLQCLQSAWYHKA